MADGPVGNRRKERNGKEFGGLEELRMLKATSSGNRHGGDQSGRLVSAVVLGTIIRHASINLVGRTMIPSK